MEDWRYNYDFHKGSLVIDAGGFAGDFSAEIFRRFECRVICFEPLPDYYAAIRKRLDPRVLVLNHGLGGSAREVTFRAKGDSTGAFATGPADKEFPVQILDVLTLMDIIDTYRVDLLKLNVEGMEFEILERLVNANRLKQIVNLQVQFHECAPQAAERYARLQGLLPKTHALIMDSGWVWQNWTLL